MEQQRHALRALLGACCVLSLATPSMSLAHLQVHCGMPVLLPMLDAKRWLPGLQFLLCVREGVCWYRVAAGRRASRDHDWFLQPGILQSSPAQASPAERHHPRDRVHACPRAGSCCNALAELDNDRSSYRPMGCGCVETCRSSGPCGTCDSRITAIACTCSAAAVHARRSRTATQLRGLLPAGCASRLLVRGCMY